LFIRSGDEKTLKVADKGLAEKGVFNNVTVVDGEGNIYLVKSTKISNRSSFFEMNRLIHFTPAFPRREKISIN
jgi:hypothetical protein